MWKWKVGWKYLHAMCTWVNILISARSILFNERILTWSPAGRFLFELAVSSCLPPRFRHTEFNIWAPSRVPTKECVITAQSGLVNCLYHAYCWHEHIQTKSCRWKASFELSNPIRFQFEPINQYHNRVLNTASNLKNTFVNLTTCNIH